MATGKKKSKAKAKPSATKRKTDKAKQSAKPRRGRKPAERKPGKVKQKGPHLKSAEQHLRDSLMLAREAQGWSIEAIAKEADLTVVGARRALAKKKAAPGKMIEADPVEILEQLIQGFGGDIADLHAMGLAYADWHPSAAVGAKKAASQVRTNLLELYQSVGVLPHELGQFSVLIDLRSVVVQIVQSVDEFMKEVEERVLAGELDKKQAVTLIESAKRVGETLDQIGGVEEATNVIDGKAKEK